jgi:2-amino-4-hydroxy-6-hydroxymethyldihydropteridine diphosphokinase
MDCLIAIGSNLGDRDANLRQALHALESHPEIQLTAISHFHETAPVGGPADQGAYLNAAARLQTTLGPEALLAVLLETEAQLGRTREVHWGPRTIDLDLLLYGEQIIDQPNLQVPHPLLQQRRFVLAPAAEIAADMRHPVLRQTIAELLSQLPPDGASP